LLLAEDGPDRRIMAEPGATGTCPVCHYEVIPKCGEIKTWHWAHKSLKECDTWYEPESEWHFGWKKLAGLENTEIVIRKQEGIHRADIKIGGLVVELQHSPLPLAEVRERETFYGSMIWVLDGTSIGKFRIERWISKNDTFYLKHESDLRAWVNEIKKTKFYHFPKITIDSFYWQNEYHADGYYGPFPLKEMPVVPNPIKKWKRVPLNVRPIVLEDVLIKTNNGFCDIISKSQFVNRYFKRPKFTTTPKKSLFNF